MLSEKIISRLICFVTFLLFSCGEETIVNPPAYIYRIPEKTNDGWQTASINDVGIDKKMVSNAIVRINEHLYENVHGILIVKNGKLVLEEYFSGYSFAGYLTDYDRQTRHYLASDTKSFTSALVGIAVDHGFISNVSESAYSFFPSYSDLRNAEKDKIKVEHLLTMSAGLQWDEWSFPYSDDRNDHVLMNRSSDQIRFVLSKQVESPPGTKFVYNSGLSITLGGIINKSSDFAVDQFADKYLFGPLGITDYFWWRYSNGTFQTGGGLYMLPRDMAKFGLLYLQEGVWQGSQIVSKEWVTQSTTAHIDIDSDWSYGYQWWLKTYQIDSGIYDSFAARGWGGQYIYVFPSLDVVIVFTGGNYDTPEPSEEILVRFLLPAIVS